MKLTCMMIVAVLFLTAWTFVMADDPRDGPDTAVRGGKRFWKARNEMNSAASKLNKRECLEADYYCVLPFVGNGMCCSGICVFCLHSPKVLKLS
uniref:Mr_precursor_032 n=1 Tax=Conus marmoreus TaxID=42752 RepID=U6C1K9_CONMR|nr:Mr_precursor_032 [Conus marmoreus]